MQTCDVSNYYLIANQLYFKTNWSFQLVCSLYSYASLLLASYTTLFPSHLVRSGIPTDAEFQVSLLSRLGGWWVGGCGN